MPYRLVVTAANLPMADHAIDLERDVALVGRRAGCEVRLPDLRVGGVHLRLEREGKVVFAVDTGTPGGTSIAGKRLRPATRHALEDGDVLEVAGVFFLRYEARSPGGAKPTTRPGTSQMARAMVRQMLASLGDAGSLKAPSLIVELGPDAGARYELTVPGQTLILGRAETCDVPLMDPDLSREHARVNRDWTGATVADLGSKNGTSCRGRPLNSGEECRLEHEDRIQLGGGTILRYDDPIEDYLEKLGDSPESSASPPRNEALLDGRVGFFVAALLVIAAVAGLVMLASH